MSELKLALAALECSKSGCELMNEKDAAIILEHIAGLEKDNERLTDENKELKHQVDELNICRNCENKMKKLFEIDDIDKDEMNQWLDSMPEIIKEAYKKLPHNLVYVWKETGEEVSIESYTEHGTLNIKRIADADRGWIPGNWIIPNIQPNALERAE